MKQYFLFYRDEFFPPEVETNLMDRNYIFFEAPNFNNARQVARIIRELGFDVELFRDSTRKTKITKF